jgi:essential nuclear protein 1
MEASDEEFENYSDNELEYEEVEVDEADAEIMSKFMPSAPRAQKTLADLIMQKIEAKNAADSGNLEMQAEGKLHTAVKLKRGDQSFLNLGSIF